MSGTVIQTAESGRTHATGLLFDPRSVAVVGASGEPRKWGHLLARGALAGAGRRAVYLVNRNGGEILGQRAFPSLAALPDAPELVVVSVPPHAFEEEVDAALAAGARAVVGITAGLGERGGEAARREAALAERVRAAGAVLLGPNCLGVFDREAELELAPWLDFPAGDVGLITQSGNVALELGLLAARSGLGFSRFASVGNQADLEAADLLENLAAHDATRVIAVYLEDCRDGRRLARAAASAGKPVVLLAAGTSKAGARAARSHTGALVSESAAVDAACRSAGIVRVSTPQELIDAAEALVRGRPAPGRRLAVFGDGGGHGVVAADVATSAGFELPELSEPVRSRLAAVLPPTAATANPVDFAGGEEDLDRFERAARILLESREVDALLLTGYFGGYGGEVAELGARELEVAGALGSVPGTLVVHTLYPESPAAQALRTRGVLVHREVERAVRALGFLTPRPAGRVPELPEALDVEVVEGYFGARELVATAGVPLPAGRIVRSRVDAAAAAAELGFPLVLKTLAQNHKSDAGGVVLRIRSGDELERAYCDLAERLGPECAVERFEEREDGVELIVGVRRDPRFGPLLLVGFGGVSAEMVRDVAVALAPVDADEVEFLLRSLRAAPLLDGVRGRRAVDVRAAAEAAAGLSRLAAAAPAIRELEVNPLLVGPEDAVALDARVVRAD
jgi:acyl-CoA synthetase (NDP forming)